MQHHPERPVPEVFVRFALLVHQGEDQTEVAHLLQIERRPGHLRAPRPTPLRSDSARLRYVHWAAASNDVYVVARKARGCKRTLIPTLLLVLAGSLYWYDTRYEVKFPGKRLEGL